MGLSAPAVSSRRAEGNTLSGLTAAGFAGATAGAGCANFGEGGNAFVQVRTLVGGRDLHADAGLSLGHYRIVETGYVDAFIEQACSYILREFGIIKHYCTNC